LGFVVFVAATAYYFGSYLYWAWFTGSQLGDSPGPFRYTLACNCANGVEIPLAVFYGPAAHVASWCGFPYGWSACALCIGDHEVKLDRVLILSEYAGVVITMALWIWGMVLIQKR
jgi:ABC-type uncharacterized transport system permease subunit